MEDKDIEQRLRQIERKMLKRIDERFDQLTELLQKQQPKTLMTQEELAEYLRLAPSTMRKRDKSIYPSVLLPDKDGNPSTTVRYIKEEVWEKLLQQVT